MLIASAVQSMLTSSILKTCERMHPVVEGLWQLQMVRNALATVVALHRQPVGAQVFHDSEWHD